MWITILIVALLIILVLALTVRSVAQGNVAAR